MHPTQQRSQCHSSAAAAAAVQPVPQKCKNGKTLASRSSGPWPFAHQAGQLSKEGEYEGIETQNEQTLPFNAFEDPLPFAHQEQASSRRNSSPETQRRSTENSRLRGLQGLPPLVHLQAMWHSTMLKSRGGTFLPLLWDFHASAEIRCSTHHSRRSGARRCFSPRAGTILLSVWSEAWHTTTRI